MIVGHARVVHLMEQTLPAVTLLFGPVSVGKRTIAEHVGRRYGVIQAEQIRIEHITSEIVRELINHSNFQSRGPFKLVIARLDGASENALNSMLKLLEEPPASTRFILLASRPTLPTIMSRSVILRCGLLTDAQVAAVLQLTGMSADHASRLAECGRGSVRDALASEQQGAVKSLMLAALKAVALKDAELLARTMTRWTDESHAMLIQWAFECASGRWVVFTETESYGLAAQPAIARVMLGALSAASTAPSRLVARAVLEDACSRR